MATNFAVPFNNILTTVATDRSVGGPSLVLSSVSGISLTGSQWCRISIIRGTTPITILKATAVNTGTNTLTISGAIEVSDAAVLAGDTAFVGETAGTLSDIYTSVNTLETTYAPLASPTFTGAVALGSSVTGTASAMTVTATNGTTAFSLATIGARTINVKDFGATGNGTTDDTTAIQAALNACPVGGVVYIPAGNYKTTAALTAPVGMTIRGDFADSSLGDSFGSSSYASNTPNHGTVIAATQVSGYAFTSTAPHFQPSCIRDICFKGVGDNTRTTVGLRISFDDQAQTRFKLQNVSALNFFIGFDFAGTEQCVATGLYALGCDTGLYLGLNANSNQFFGIHVTACTVGITLDGATNNCFVGGAAQGSRNTGFKLINNSEENAFYSFYFESATGTYAIDVQSGDRNEFIMVHASVNCAVRFLSSQNRMRIGKYFNSQIITAGGGNLIEGLVPPAGQITDTGFNNVFMTTNNSGFQFVYPTGVMTTISNVGIGVGVLPTSFAIDTPTGKGLRAGRYEFDGPNQPGVLYAASSGFRASTVTGTDMFLNAGGSTRTIYVGNGGECVVMNCSTTPSTAVKLTVNTPVTVDTAASAQITAISSSRKALVVQAVASQSVNIQEWQSSTGGVLGSVSSIGNYGFGPIAATYGIHQLGGCARIQAIATPGNPSVTVNSGSGTNYYYFIVAEDRNGHKTLPSTVSNTANSSTTPDNTITWTSVPGSVKYYILRYTANTLPASGTLLVATWTSGALSVHDTVAPASLVSFTVPTLNATADLTIDGTINVGAHYPGSDATEINGAQTAQGSWTATEQKMLQTVYNLARSFGLLA